jgi:endonuclease YncB( thermonuclease family)
VLIGLALGAVQVHAAEGAACTLPAGNPAAIAAVVDARTLRLADGTELRLTGLEDLAHAGDATAAETAAKAARFGLERLVLGNAVAVQSLGEDRYGRRIALVALAGGAESLQEQLLLQGNALVAASVSPPSCAARFLAAERRARMARIGLWANPHYLIRQAGRPDTFAGERGRFALVEGTVRSVNDRGATIYVNFGGRWSEDFTVTIAKRNMRNFTSAGLDPLRLAGRNVRIRGWVDERGGPWIEALRPEQIELADRN